MKLETLLSTLTNLQFICLEVVDELHPGWPLKQSLENGSSSCANLLSNNLKRWPSSKRTLETYEKFQQSPNWDNFHECSHYLLVDKLVHFLKTGEGQNIALVIDETLRCGIVSDEFIKAVEFYTFGKTQIAA